MDWYKKTDEQYDSYITLMMGGDNENEIQLTEDNWAVVMCALSDLIDLFTGDLRLKELKENWEYQDAISELYKIKSKIIGIEKFDNSPIYISELDHRRLLAGKESVIDFIERQRASKDLEKLTKEKHNAQTKEPGS
tara:strand:- start:899 stop:1306 length:408 start_codon:yes stop_codon:yes gene_type:complete